MITSDCAQKPTPLPGPSERAPLETPLATTGGGIQDPGPNAIVLRKNRPPEVALTATLVTRPPLTTLPTPSTGTLAPDAMLPPKIDNQRPGC